MIRDRYDFTEEEKRSLHRFSMHLLSLSLSPFSSSFLSIQSFHPSPFNLILSSRALRKGSNQVLLRSVAEPSNLSYFFSQCLHFPSIYFSLLLLIFFLFFFFSDTQLYLLLPLYSARHGSGWLSRQSSLLRGQAANERYHRGVVGDSKQFLENFFNPDRGIDRQ